MTCVFCMRQMDGEPIVEGGCRDCADTHHLTDGDDELRAALALRDQRIATLEAVLRSIAEGVHETSRHCPVCTAQEALASPSAADGER